MTKLESDKSGNDHHTSIVFVHGVGDPKRHVSMSNFLDQFDLYAQGRSTPELGFPRKYQHKTELFGDEPLNFIEFKKIVKTKDRDRIEKSVRVYEAFWSPEAQATFGIFYIIKWAFLRLLIPLFGCFSEWRKYPASKLLLLHELAFDSIKLGDAQILEKKYREFENWELRKQHPKGLFSDFILFISSVSHIQDDDKNRLIKIAHTWRKSYVKHNISVFLYFIFTILSLISVVILFAKSIQVLLISYGNWYFNVYYSIAFTVASLGVFLMPSILNLTSYISDVIVWTMETEKDFRFSNRDKVVSYSQKLIKHVVGNKSCDDCVIVAHSLGTSIAMEAILKEGKLALISGDNGGVCDESVANISKVKSIFIAGSPIDHIFSLFQSDRTFSHRYQRFFEGARLSLNVPPFWNDKKAGPAVLINFWSRLDPISSRVFSLRKNLGERKNAIINHEVFPRGAPNPLAVHTQYFSDHHVMKEIYWAVMQSEQPQNKVQSLHRVLKFGRVFGWAGGLFVVLVTALFLYAFLDHYITALPLSAALILSALYYISQIIWSKRARRLYDS